MQQTSSAPPQDLWQALREMFTRPLQTLVPPWSWKAAAFTATVRALAFFATNLRSVRAEATKALLVEAAFALVTGELIGAISQQLRRAEPVWGTATVVWIGLPGTMLLAQTGIHRLAHTPHLTGGVVLSFCLAAVSAAFSWFAMRHGVMLGGVDETTINHDLKLLPGIFVRFLLAGPATIASILRRH